MSARPFKLREHLGNGKSFGQALLLNGAAEEPPLRFLARELGLAFVELEGRVLSREFLSQFPARVLLQ